MSNLKDKVIISTRPLSSNDTISDYLKGRGATVLEFPLIEISAAEIDRNSEHILREIETFDWIIFTSKNGVKYFFSILKTFNSYVIIPPNIKIAVIGKVTAEALNENGITPFYISAGNNSENFLKELSVGIIRENERILLPLGNLANDKLEKGLSEFAIVKRIDVYQTTETKNVSKEIIDAIRNDNYDLIVFTSPSGFSHFNNLMKENSCYKVFRIACIGKTTEKEILKHGYRPLIVSAKSDGVGLAVEIDNYFNGISKRPRIFLKKKSADKI